MAAGRKTGGRAFGTPNKATADIKALAQVHGPAAIARLVKLMGADSGQTSVAAARELLDRGYGKARQPLEHSSDGTMQLGLIAIPLKTERNDA